MIITNCAQHAVPWHYRDGMIILVNATIIREYGIYLRVGTNYYYVYNMQEFEFIAVAEIDRSTIVLDIDNNGMPLLDNYKEFDEYTMNEYSTVNVPNGRTVFNGGSVVALYGRLEHLYNTHVCFLFNSSANFIHFVTVKIELLF